MAEFVRAQIFGTTFEITSRYFSLALAQVAGFVQYNIDPGIGTRTYNLWGWEPLALSGNIPSDQL